MAEDVEPLKLGFIGAGEMATWAVYPALHLAPIALRAVCDLDEARAKSVAARFGAGRWYTDYRRMWAQEDLEALVVQMHPGPRHSIVLEALEAGYHVFIPKPPATSLAGTIELAKAARRANRTLMVNFQRRFSFGVTRARKIIATPAFGRLTQVLCSSCSGTYGGARGRHHADAVQAYLLDFAVHHLDLARWLGGEVAKLAVFHQTIDDGIALALALEFRGGAVGSLQLNSQRVWHRNYDRIEITGQGEYVVLDGLWTFKHYTGDRNSFSENYSDERSGELTGDGPALVEFVEAIREGREPIASIADSVETMRLLQAILEAVEEGRDGVIRTV